MQELADAQVIQAYGQRQATFGGVRFDGDVVVALFTDDLDRHDELLRPRLLAPQNFRLQRADRTYAQIEAVHRRVQEVLMGNLRPHPEVDGVGIGWHDGQFANRVTVLHPTDELADAIRRTVAPDEVVILPGGEWVLYGPT